MMNPVRTTAGWLAGRVMVFLLILAALVAMDVYSEESKLMGAMMMGLVPAREHVDTLLKVRADVEAFALDAEEKVNKRLRVAQTSTPAEIEAAIADLRLAIKAKESTRRSATLRSIALVTGEGLLDDMKTEADIKLKTAELNGLIRVRDALNDLSAALRDAEQDFEAKRKLVLTAERDFNQKVAERDAYLERNRLELFFGRKAAREHAAGLLAESKQLKSAFDEAGKKYFEVKKNRDNARSPRPRDMEQVRLASAAILEPLDKLIATKKAAVDSAERQAVKILESIQNVFLTALAILVALTLGPVGIKALWYWGIAQFAERQRPIRLRPGAIGMVVADKTGGSGVSTQAKVSAVSQEVVIDGREELLVHPEFLQSSADHAHKRTKWLLSWHYWFMSIAANMVFIDRIRAPDGATFVVSSKNDAFAEVGVLPLPEGAALVLQPRNLVGLVQAIDLPIRITRKWNWGVMAFITLQFRYLIFEGPGKLIVQGCRGVRVEQAGTGRSIDQAATIGFSANLDYSPRRSETFGAYLLGTRGLFNDRFSGGPGVYVYEEMPYFGKKSGITGRGLEGLTDGLLRVVGI